VAASNLRKIIGPRYTLSGNGSDGLPDT